jgi:hypothetical protein
MQRPEGNTHTTSAGRNDPAAPFGVTTIPLIIRAKWPSSPQEPIDAILECLRRLAGEADRFEAASCPRLLDPWPALKDVDGE